jgi:hypothetical protein
LLAAVPVSCRVPVIVFVRAVTGNVNGSGLAAVAVALHVQEGKILCNETA